MQGKGGRAVERSKFCARLKKKEKRLWPDYNKEGWVILQHTFLLKAKAMATEGCELA